MRKPRAPGRVGRPSPSVVLTRSERKLLNKITLEEGLSRYATRVRIVLAASYGQSGVEIARTQRVSVQTVAKWRTRYLSEGLKGLLHRRSPRPGARLAPDLGARVTRLIASGGMTTREIAEDLGISQTSVVRLARGSRWPKVRRARR